MNSHKSFKKRIRGFPGSVPYCFHDNEEPRVWKGFPYLFSLFIFVRLSHSRCLGKAGWLLEALLPLEGVRKWSLPRILHWGSPGFDPWVGKIPRRRDWLPTPVLGFPGGSDGKESACNAGDPGSIPGLGRSPGGGHGYPLQDSWLENPSRVQRNLAGCSL